MSSLPSNGRAVPKVILPMRRLLGFLLDSTCSVKTCRIASRRVRAERAAVWRNSAVPTGNSELLGIMEFKRLAASLFRCVSCQLSSPFFGLLSAPASHWNGERCPSPPAQRLEKVRPTTSPEASRSLFMVRPLARLAKLARGAGHRPARDRRIASPGLWPVLGLESAPRQTRSTAGSP
jgi:hypothetical protein